MSLNRPCTCKQRTSSKKLLSQPFTTTEQHQDKSLNHPSTTTERHQEISPNRPHKTVQHSHSGNIKEIIFLVKFLSDVIDGLPLRCDVIDEVMDRVVILLAHDVDEELLGGQEVQGDIRYLPGDQRVVLRKGFFVHLWNAYTLVMCDISARCNPGQRAAVHLCNTTCVIINTPPLTGDEIQQYFLILKRTDFTNP